MCGRLACTLCSSELSKACAFPKKVEDVDSCTYTESAFVERGVFTYVPCYNLCPSEVVPVLIHKSHVTGITSESDYVIIPMRWGLLPPNNFDVAATLHNARIENVNHSTLFKPELEKNHRCVILCDGYFEWQTTRKDTQPFYITQQVATSKSSSVNEDNEDEIKEWVGKPVLKLAGLFSIQTDAEGNTKYSCSVITTEADKSLSWLHHRMPISLKTYDDVENWINCQKMNSRDSFNFLHSYGNTESKTEKKPKYELKYHAVDKKLVNNARNKSEWCIAPINHKRQMTLDSWCSNKRGPAASNKKE